MQEKCNSQFGLEIRIAEYRFSFVIQTEYHARNSCIFIIITYLFFDLKASIACLLLFFFLKT